MILTTDMLSGTSPVVLACDTSTGQLLRLLVIAHGDGYFEIVFEARASRDTEPVRSNSIVTAVREFNRGHNMKEAA